MTASPSSYYSRYHKAKEEEDDQVLKKEIWRRKCGQWVMVQLEEDRGSSTVESWMDTSGQWPMLHRE